MMMIPVREALELLCQGKDLSGAQMSALFSRIIQGEISEIELSALLMALKAKGETPEEIAGAAQAIRQAAIPFPTDGIDVADTCGTGGDGLRTVNLSTAVAIICAEAGLAVAKHGNRSVSSACGSADLLEQAGVNLQASAAQSLHCLRETGICFLFAPSYHQGIRFAMNVRKTLGVRTIFNLLGPLLNPARPLWQIMGVYHPDLCGPLARSLSLLGCKSALVVHGDGMDEIALHGETQAVLYRDGHPTVMTLTPEGVGIKRFPIETLRGGNPQENAHWLGEMLAGKGSEPHRYAVALNAGALLWISNRATGFAGGFDLAMETIKTGKAVNRLARCAELSHVP
jgi:anthranilate phosphoribosyltransferase